MISMWHAFKLLVGIDNVMVYNVYDNLPVQTYIHIHVYIAIFVRKADYFCYEGYVGKELFCEKKNRYWPSFQPF